MRQVVGGTSGRFHYFASITSTSIYRVCLTQIVCCLAWPDSALDCHTWFVTFTVLEGLFNSVRLTSSVP